MLLRTTHGAAACFTRRLLACGLDFWSPEPGTLAAQATGALDADTEAALYAGLAGRVGAYVSVGE
jgi:hypothetical protein